MCPPSRKTETHGVPLATVNKSRFPCTKARNLFFLTHKFKVLTFWVLSPHWFLVTDAASLNVIYVNPVSGSSA